MCLTCTMAAAGPNHVSAVTYARKSSPYDIVGVVARSTPMMHGIASSWLVAITYALAFFQYRDSLKERTQHTVKPSNGAA